MRVSRQGGMRPISPRNLGAVSSTQQKPIINVAARVVPKIQRPLIPLWFLNDRYDAKVAQAVKTATVRASQAGEMTDRAFTSALHRTPTSVETASVKVTAERMAADGASMADIARYLEEKTKALPEAVALRDGIETLKQVTREQLGREATPREIAASRETSRELFTQQKTPDEVKAAFTAQLQAALSSASGTRLIR